MMKKFSFACLFLVTLSVFAQDKSRLNDQTQIPRAPHKAKDPQYFIPPQDSELQNNAFAELVRRGEALFVNTKDLAGQHVGNELSCVNCHMDRGRKANAGPLWAAYPMYPAYRKKNNKVNSLVERIQGCFQFSMNGTPPAADSEVLSALSAYAYWLSTGAPTGKALPGRGYDEPPPPPGGFDIGRGEVVYKEQCQICHGAEGEGQKVGSTVVFPPLWGKNSYNWGAGMHRINTAAGFIQHNMPLGKGKALNDTQAWDVAAFINSHERPQDPRLVDGSIELTRKRFHEGDGTNLYGVKVNGVLIGQGTR
jgi:thiosulfate dehydrogenase